VFEPHGGERACPSQRGVVKRSKNIANNIRFRQ
jgi:hypothetical protein